MKSFIALLTVSFAFARGAVDAPKDVFYGNYTIKDSIRVNLLPPVRNQNQPRACDASWAFASTTTMSTLFNLQKLGAFPEVVLSPQMLINCAPDAIKFNCTYGATPVAMAQVLKHLKENGVSDESCNNYHASDEKSCSDLNQCKDCHNAEDMHKTPVCSPVPHRVYKLSDYSAITSSAPDDKKIADLTDKVIQALQDGPLLCRMDHTEKLFTQRSSKVTQFVDDDISKATYSTWVSLVGYQAFSTGAKVPLFAVQTSFGENVGYYGFVFLLADGAANPNNILSNCYSLQIEKEPTYVANNYRQFVNSILTDKGVKTTRFRSAALNQGLKLAFTGKKFNEGLTIVEDNTPINWQNNEGINYVTYVKNQHIPTYCGSCWAQAAASVLADRLNIQRIKAKKVFPKFNLSVQAIINCKEGGSCFGGDSTMLFQKAQSWKVPIESCQTYQAVNPSSYECPVQNVCSNASNTGSYNFDKYTGVKVTEWGRARGAAAIKAALLDGPVICDFMVTEEFVEYKKLPNKLNIWDKQSDFISINHAVSVVGWGKLDDKEFWIVRNSWGREWGYDGFFYMQIGDNILGIESECSWAKVVLEEFE